MARLFYVVIFLIAYGSLYPFDFSLSALSAGEAERLFTSWTLYSGRGDVLGNIALFVPYGLFGVLATPRQRSFAGACVSLSIFGVMFAALLQIVQLGIVSRDAEMGDVIWNLAGIVLGAAMAQPRWVRDIFDVRGGTHAERALPMALFGLWAIATFAPFVPTVDFQAYKDSLKPLLHGAFALDEFLQATVSWFVVAYIGPELARYLPAGRLREQRVWLPLLVAGTLLAKIVIVQNALTLSDVLAAVVAVPCWFLVLRLGDSVPRFLLSLLCISLFVSAFSPFGLRDETASFHWIPFTGSLTGSMTINAKVLAGKTFVIGALFLMCRRCDYPLLPVTLAAAGYLLALETGQVWIGDHTPEITDAVLAAAAGIAFALLGDRFGALPPPEEEPPAGPAPTAARVGTHAPSTTQPALPGRTPLMSRGGAILLAAGCGAAVIGMYAVLSLPGIPYNVRELFGGREGVFDLVKFVLAIVCIGAGGALAGRRAAGRRFPAIGLPGIAIAAGTISFLLLDASVSGESLSDIVGSSTADTRTLLWGGAGNAIFGALGASTAATFERMIRYGALTGPFILWSGIFVGTWLSARAGKSALETALRFALYLLCALPWLYLCKIVTIDRASTDNLTELFEGGGGMLYPLYILLPFAAVLLVRARGAGGVLKSLLLLALSLPVSWVFLTAGLADEVRKYDKTFSAMTFLLAPDRDADLSYVVLMARWFGVQEAATLAIAFGMRIFLPAGRPPRDRENDD